MCARSIDATENDVVDLQTHTRTISHRNRKKYIHIHRARFSNQYAPSHDERRCRRAA